MSNDKNVGFQHDNQCSESQCTFVNSALSHCVCGRIKIAISLLIMIKYCGNMFHALAQLGWQLTKATHLTAIEMENWLECGVEIVCRILFAAFEIVSIFNCGSSLEFPIAYANWWWTFAFDRCNRSKFQWIGYSIGNNWMRIGKNETLTFNRIPTDQMSCESRRIFECTH